MIISFPSIQRTKVVVTILTFCFVTLAYFVLTNHFRSKYLREERYSSPLRQAKSCDQWSCSQAMISKSGNWAHPRPELPEAAFEEWIFEHKGQVESSHQLSSEIVVFAGDEIIEMWIRHSSPSKENVPLDRYVWETSFVSNTVSFNLGIRGDRVQDLGWRLENGILGTTDEIDPVVITIMIGAHDIESGESTEVIIEEMRHMVKMITEKRSETAILLIGPLPRGDEGDESQVHWDSKRNNYFSRITAINQELSQLPQEFGDLVFYVDCSSYFLTKRRHEKLALSKHLMYDYFHLTSAGYERLSSCIHSPLHTAYVTAMSIRYS
eukprot:c17472_g1_i1.p1 GENE.c17472_g1_i1~~c17472_g1_i1.p1  ORF type:complete len:323 (-),score=76.76 c17472_g1_i1:195-1163(-)